MKFFNGPPSAVATSVVAHAAANIVKFCLLRKAGLQLFPSFPDISIVAFFIFYFNNEKQKYADTIAHEQ